MFICFSFRFVCQRLCDDSRYCVRCDGASELFDCFFFSRDENEKQNNDNMLSPPAHKRKVPTHLHILHSDANGSRCDVVCGDRSLSNQARRWRGARRASLGHGERPRLLCNHASSKKNLKILLGIQLSLVKQYIVTYKG